MKPRCRTATAALAISLLFALFSASCANRRLSQPGEILVDRPEVFTRERLVNRRLNELQWLEQQLAREVTSSLQGARERRSFSGFAAGLEAQFDPFGAAGAGASIQTSQSAELGRRVQNELFTTAIEQKLKALESGNIGFQDVLGTNATTIQSPETTNTFAPSPPTMGVFNFGTSNIPSALAGTNLGLVSDRLQLTSVEQFQDQLARRDAIQAQMRERELDDSHDQAGMTLYTLKFDVSVLPGEYNPWFGRVDVAIERGSEAVDYRSWVEAVRRYIDAEMIAIQQRYLLGFLTQEEKRMLLTARFNKASKLVRELSPKAEQVEQKMRSARNREAEGAAASGEAERAIRHGSAQELNRYTHVDSRDLADSLKALRDFRALNQVLLTADRSGTKDPAPGKPLTDEARWALAALCRLVADDFTESLTTKFLNEADPVELVDIGPPGEVADVSSGLLCLCPVATNDTGPAALARVVARLEAKAEPFVYTVEPKQYAQNLSDVGSRELVRSFALQLAAAIPQAGTKLGAHAEYVQRTQWFLETIKRIPLITGFVTPAKRFGWILGPRFRVGEKADLTFEQIAVQHSVQATVAVPEWWADLRVETATGWLDRDGRALPAARKQQAATTIRLTPNLDALTEAIRQKNDDRFLKPTIFPQWDASGKAGQFVVQPRRPAELLILGRNLWRNPEVFIGSQSTRDIQVLPDMQGIVARFADIQPVLTASGEPDEAVDLRVVTSAGQSLLKDGVRIVSAAGAPEKRPRVSLPRQWAVAAGKLEVVVDPQTMPGSYVGFLLLMAVQGDPLTQVGGVSWPRDGKLSFDMPAANAPWNVPREARLDIQFKAAPDQNPVSLLSNGPAAIVVFVSTNQAAFRIPPGPVSVVTNRADGLPAINLRVQPPDLTDLSLFWKAWPDLKTQIEGNKAFLRLSKEKRTYTAPTGSFADGEATVMLDQAAVAAALTPGKDGEEFTASIILSTAREATAIPAGSISIKGISQ